MLQNPDLEEKSNEELFRLYRENGSTEVKQALTLRYVYIVRSVACQMREIYRDVMQLEDVVNEGVIEIMRAIDRYDETKDNKFETFISRRIRGMVIDMIRRNDWLPRNYHKENRRIQEADAELQKKLGRTATEEELGRKLNMSPKRIQKIRQMGCMVNVLSLDRTFDESDDVLVQIPAEDPNVQPERHYLNGENVRTLSAAIESLPEKEKIVVSLYYVEELNMSQIAEVMELSQPRVSQLHSMAIRKLRAAMTEYVREG